MAVAAWNPSTLKLYAGTSGLLCRNCCSSGPSNCPTSYTISFKNIARCTTPTFPVFQTRPYPGSPPIYNVVYNGASYRLLSNHYADQFYPDAWAKYDWPYPLGNKTFTLQRCPDELCWYCLNNDDVDIVLEVVRKDGYTQMWLSYTDKKYKQFVEAPYPYQRTNFKYFYGYSQESGVAWCQEIDNLASDVDHLCLSMDYTQQTWYGNFIGHDGYAKVFSGEFLDWVVNKVYSDGDIVVHNAEKYVCIAGHASTLANEPGVGSLWSLYWEVSTVC